MMNYRRLTYLIGLGFILLTVKCAQPDTEKLVKESVEQAHKYQGPYTSETSSGEVSYNLRSDITDAEWETLEELRELNIKEGTTEGQSLLRGDGTDVGDPTPLEECYHFYGVTGNGDEDDEDCVSNVWNSFRYGADGDCDIPLPCQIAGGIYGRSEFGESCNWAIVSFGTVITATANTFGYDFDVYLACGSREYINIYANGTLVDQYIVGCSPCWETPTRY